MASDPDDLAVYRIEDGETRWVVAEDMIDALKAFCDGNGFPPSELDSQGGIEIERLRNDCKVKVRGDDEQYTEKTAREWAGQNGRGILASTCY